MITSLASLSINCFTVGLPKIRTREALTILSGAVALLYTSSKMVPFLWEKESSKYKEIPMPTEGYYPIVGHFLSLGDEQQFEEKLAAWHKELGPVLKLKFGVQTWIFINDPHLAQDVFVTNGSKSSGRSEAVYRYHYHGKGGKGAAFSKPDVGWRKARSAVLATVAPQKVKRHAGALRFESTALVNRILNEIDNGKGIMFPLETIQLATFNVAFNFALGARFNSYQDEKYRVLKDLLDENFAFEDLKYEVPNFIPALYHPLHHLFGKSELESYVKRHDSIMLPIIREAGTKDGENMIKMLRENGSELSEEELLVLTADFIGGGTDTSLITLLGIIKFMCVYPEAQSKAAAEISNFVTSYGRLPKFNERDELPYCICVIKECMRLNPTVPFGVPHTATEDIEVDGYLIPKGDILISSMHSMHRNTSFYPDEPEKFKPERFMSNIKTMHAAANGKLDDRDHFNFGWGRRRCPAPYIAEMEIFFIFTDLLSKCTIRPAPNSKINVSDGKKSHFEVEFSRRHSCV